MCFFDVSVKFKLMYDGRAHFSALYTQTDRIIEFGRSIIGG